MIGLIDFFRGLPAFFSSFWKISVNPSQISHIGWSKSEARKFFVTSVAVYLLGIYLITPLNRSEIELIPEIISPRVQAFSGLFFLRFSGYRSSIDQSSPLLSSLEKDEGPVGWQIAFYSVLNPQLVEPLEMLTQHPLKKLGQATPDAILETLEIDSAESQLFENGVLISNKIHNIFRSSAISELFFLLSAFGFYCSLNITVSRSLSDMASKSQSVEIIVSALLLYDLIYKSASIFIGTGLKTSGFIFSFVDRLLYLAMLYFTFRVVRILLSRNTLKAITQFVFFVVLTGVLMLSVLPLLVWPTMFLFLIEEPELRSTLINGVATYIKEVLAS